jgi:hypothetical protein
MSVLWKPYLHSGGAEIMANYPSSLPSFTSPISTNYLTSPDHALQHQSENNEIVAIATELGTLVKGAYPSARDRFEAIEASLSTKIGSIVGTALRLVRYNATSNGIEDSGYVPADFAPVVHSHNDLYYTDVETDSLLDGKIDVIIGDVTKFATFTGTGQLANSGYGWADFDAAGTSAAGIAAHLAVHTASVEHNPYVVGSKQVDESLISDGKVLYFNFENNQLQYGDVIDVSQEEIEDYVAAMMIAGTGPTTWVYTDGAGTLQVNLPQSVAVAATPTFANLILSSSTDGGVLVGNGAGALQFTAVGTAGHVLTSNGPGTDPTFQAAGGASDGASLHHVFANFGG